MCLVVCTISTDDFVCVTSNDITSSGVTSSCAASVRVAIPDVVVVRVGSAVVCGADTAPTCPVSASGTTILGITASVAIILVRLLPLLCHFLCVATFGADTFITASDGVVKLSLTLILIPFFLSPGGASAGTVYSGALLVSLVIVNVPPTATNRMVV